MHWTLNTLDAEQHITQQTSGNGVIANQTFDPKTGRLTSVGAGFQNMVENLSFTYDGLGNLTGRTDGNGSFSETFTYDPLNRLTSAAISTGAYPAKSFAYDPIGNLTSKSDVGTYSYPTPGAAQPHAVSSIGGGTINTSFSYDGNGNQTAGLGRSITWTSYNKPASITQGSRTLSFLDDPNHQRFQQVTPQGTTLYFDSFGAHAEFMPGSGQWNEYLKVGNVMVGVRFLALATETVTLRYFHTDHLGSIAVITDQNGAVSERLSYDAWGKRRFANGADDPAGSIASQTTYGFTGQEELSVTGLVHLNGRVYDSLIGRMMSADPTVPDALNPQAWNRYSYVGNDPLTFTDPTGYSWLSSFFSSIGNFFKSIFSNSIVRAIVQIALAVILTPVFNGVIFLAAAASAAIVTGLAGGKLGQVLKAAVIAGAQALAFDAVAGVTGHNPAFGTLEYFENVAGHAAVGCVSAVASGGKCGPGALSAAVPAAAAPLVADVTQNAPDKFTRTIEGSAASGVLGGLASVAGGGKFADGAVTGAFGYLFNACGGPHGCAALGGAVGTGVGVAASTVCDVGTAGACTVADPVLIAASSAAGAAAGAAADAAIDGVHGNSAASMQGTEVYYLINRSTGDIDKIGITSYGEARYSQSFYEAENVRYEAQAQYQWRYPAMVDENIRLTWYYIDNGQLPRLNKSFR